MTKQESNEARTLADVLATLRVIEAIGHANLTLAPLQGGGRQRLNYALGAEAIASGGLAITEVSGPRAQTENGATFGNGLVVLTAADRLSV
jgi:hypothetical protein